ncbi:alpha/beta fold hydrolase [Celeribacter sp.]|uniref:alpha/beta fold hydrolase n=1 Tax=Celeribacter sp. TaxID=1890673 RepID=UPI003A95322D
MADVTERVETIGVLIGDLIADVSVRIWEARNAKASVVCVHGFGGTSHDFAPLAETLVQSGITVIAPDMFGRGNSTFFLDPTLYTLRNQMSALAVTQRYQLPNNCFLGTSWGGLMILAHVASIGWDTKGVILNDCPIQANATVQDLREQLTEEAVKVFETRDEAAQYVLTSRSMDFLEGAWRERFIESRILNIAGKWRLNYDPTLGETLRVNAPFSVEALLKRAPRPVLMSFGTQSPYAADPLNDGIARANPNITLLKSMSDPHPPSLMKTDQIFTIAGFLARCLG